MFIGRDGVMFLSIGVAMAMSSADLVINEADESAPLMNGSAEGDVATMATGSSSEVTASGSAEYSVSRVDAEVEMTQIYPKHDATPPGGVITGAASMAVVVHQNNIQEPCVDFIIKDVKDTDWTKPRLNCSLPLSSALTDLYVTVAKQAGEWVWSTLVELWNTC